MTRTEFLLLLGIIAACAALWLTFGGEPFPATCAERCHPHAELFMQNECFCATHEGGWMPAPVAVEAP